MAKRLYVGNLIRSVTSADLRTLFEEHGAVETAEVQVDRETGKGRGFGFVVMKDDAEAVEAINRLDGTDYQSRRINVNEAQPKLVPPPRLTGRPPKRLKPGPGPDRRS